MNIKKVDKERYLEAIEKYTVLSELNTGKYIRTIDYDYKHINYLMPPKLFNSVEGLIHDFIASKKIFNIKDIENLIFDMVFEVYRKNVAAKKIAMYFINALLIEKKIATDNFYDFERI